MLWNIVPVKIHVVDFSVLNGEGYKKIQADSTFKTTFGLTIRPFNGFILRGYYDMMNHKYNQQTLSLFAGYTYKTFRAGIEYNNQKDNGMLNDHTFPEYPCTVHWSLQKNSPFSADTII